MSSSRPRREVQAPPLQNIPIRTPLGKEIRAALARPRVFMNVDFSELECRIIEQLKEENDGRE